MPERSSFSFVGLLVLLFGGLFIATVSATGVQQAQEDSKAAECKSNLKQLAIAMHNYHEAHNALPVYTVSNDDGYASWALLITPYLDDKETFESFALSERCDSETNLPVVNGFRGKVWQCPTRRSEETYDFPANWLTNATDGDFQDMMPTDYVAAHTGDTFMWSHQANGMIINPKESIKAGSKEAPKSTVTFASATDGTSNTALLGEKHMAKAWLGKPTTPDGRDGFDMPTLMATNGPMFTRVAGDMTAFGTITLAPRPSYDHNVDPLSINMFGSWHDRVTHFANADGGVRAILNNTDAKTLRLYLGRADGEATFDR